MIHEQNKKKSRGWNLADRSPEQRREIARLGGEKASERGTAHHFTKEEASAAGRRGGSLGYRPQYMLFVRCRDRALCLIDQRTQEPIAIVEVLPSKIGGVYIRPRDATGIYLMNDEIQRVEKLPDEL